MDTVTAETVLKACALNWKKGVEVVVVCVFVCGGGGVAVQLAVLQTDFKPEEQEVRQKIK